MTTPTPPPPGAVILDTLRAALARYVVLPSTEAADAVTLWIAASHAQPAWAHAPRLVIRAPEKRCGKSRLLDIVEATCHSPLITVNASTAAIYRSIDDDPPTLLVDEADTIFGGTAGKSADTNEDLRGLLNAGHQRNRPAIRWDHTTRTLEKCPTFAMAALAGIGAMPDTIEDRAVIIRMRRRAPGEKVSPYRFRRDRPALRATAEHLASWLRPHLTLLEKAEPAMPVEDRAADTWEPLVAVADHAGQHWPARARAAVVALTAQATTSASDSLRVRLLAGIHAAFDLLGNPSEARTEDLLAALNGDTEAPWAGLGPAGLTGKKMGDLLAPFEISSETIRFTVGQAKGYRRAAFADAWARYTPASGGVPVPSVPTSFSQVNPGTDCIPGTHQSVPNDLGTDRTVPANQSVPALTRHNELGTDGTDTPPSQHPTTHRHA